MSASLVIPHPPSVKGDDTTNYFIGTRIQPADRADYWKVYISRTSRIQDPPVALTELDSDLYLTALVDYDQDGLADFDEFEFIHLAMN